MRPRNRLLVDPAVQYSIGLRIVMHWVLFMITLVLSSIVIRVITMTGEVPFTGALLIALKAQLPVIVISVLLIPVFLRDTLQLTNRFAGPMSRLRQAIELLTNGGENKPLKFRKGDFWQPVAGQFNLVIEEVETLRRRTQELEAELERVRASQQVSV